MTIDFYQDFFERSADALLIIKGSRFVDCNAAALQMLRCDNKIELLDSHPSDLSPEKQPDGRFSKEKAEEMIAIAGKNGSHRFEWVHKRFSGEEFPVEVLLTLAPDGNDNKLLVVWRDISERKRAENAILRLNSIIESTSDLVATATPDGRIQYMNNAGLEMLGWKREELSQKTISDAHPPRAMNAIGRALEMSVRQGIWKGETIIVHKDGHEIFASIVIMSHRRVDGQVEFFSAIIRDISERILTEATLQNNLRLLNSIIENLPSCLKIVRNDGTLLEMNPAGLKIIGAASKAEVIGQNIYQLMLESHRESFKAFNEMVCRGERGHLEFELKTLDGRIRSMESIGVPLFSYFDDETVHLGITKDITLEKKARSENLYLETQLRQAQKMESIGTLAGGIAHDFNNILSAIIGYTELALLEAENPQNLRRDLEEVLKGTNRARELVNQILTFSRKSQFQLQPIKTQLILAEALKLLRSSIPSTIEIKTDVDECCPAILADPTQFHQIIMNLCTNSYQAMKKRSGLLSISLKSEVLETIETDKPGLEPGRYVRLTISDTGEGMTKEVQEKIFEPYFTTKEKGEGTGLGLAVVHGIVSSLKGAVFVDSTPGEGACFKLFFPTCEESEREQEKSDLVAPLPRGNEKILLVDDDGVIVQMATITLEQLGYKVTSLDNSLAALKLFRENPESFDLVITDMTMPHLTGEELAELIHAIKPEIPIVISSGYSEAMSPETAHEKGITSFLQKPVKIKDLAVTVRKALERR